MQGQPEYQQYNIDNNIGNSNNQQPEDNIINQNNIQYFFANPVNRIIAEIIDELLVVTVAFIVGYTLFALGINTTNLPKKELVDLVAEITFVIIVIFLFVYRTVCEGILFSATIGKLLMGIRVVNHEGKKLDLMTAIKRNLTKTLPEFIGISILFHVLNLILIIATSKKQTVQDIVANTYVVVTYTSMQKFR
ncbi:MAG: RDD family protein [Candidatus Micrarchaeota archaeon]|nr:RDD family protein [Candidatus Micrarchaeota archaeon]